VTLGYSLAFGARFLKRTIDEQIKLPISLKWKEGTQFDVSVKEDAIVVTALQGPTTVVRSSESSMAYGDVA
jgi:ATP-dependent Clp protease ATP-binding subunit ClpA